MPLDVVNGQLKVSRNSDEDVLAIHDAIETLTEMDEQQAKLVELRFFAGLTARESAEAMGISLSTAERKWRLTKAWLRRELST